MFFVEKMIDEFDHCDAQSMQKLDLAIRNACHVQPGIFCNLMTSASYKEMRLFCLQKSNNNAGSKTFYLDNNLYVRFADEKIRVFVQQLSVSQLSASEALVSNKKRKISPTSEIDFNIYDTNLD